MNKEELKNMVRELIIEILTESPEIKVTDTDLMPLDIAYDKLLHKFYKKGYIYELVMKNKIPHHKIGNYTYFSLIELHQWLKNKKPKE